MKPASFDYLRAGSVDEALDHLARFGDRARVMAGGQSLMAMLNIRLIEPELIVDIGSIASLGQIKVEGEVVEIGAAVTQADLLAWPRLAAELPLLAQALPWVGHFQTRNRGTVCGSLSPSDPSSELPLALMRPYQYCALTWPACAAARNRRPASTGFFSTPRPSR